MAINNVMARRAGKSGGGGIGGVLGAIAGAIAAPFTAGASLAPLVAAGAGAGLGKTIGGAIGSAADPGKASTGTGVQAPNVMARRQESMGPTHSQVLEDSLKALHETQDRALQEKFGPPLFEAYKMSRA